MTRPSLKLTPQLTETYNRERWIKEGLERNGSESARDAKISILSRLDHYCKNVHKMTPEEVFTWMKNESKTPEILVQYAIDFLARYVKFCQEDHPDILIQRGRKPKITVKIKPNKNIYLHKLHNNSISCNVSRSRQFMSQVGGIRVHDDDMKRVPIPVTIKRGMYDDEEAEPLTALQARDVINRIKNNRSIALYNFMNDTGFRISEAGMVIESDFDLDITEKHPLPTVKTPKVSVKGVLTRGSRYMRKSTAIQIRILLKDDKEFIFRHSDTQSLVAFRKAEFEEMKVKIKSQSTKILRLTHSGGIEKMISDAIEKEMKKRDNKQVPS